LLYTESKEPIIRTIVVYISDIIRHEESLLSKITADKK